MYFNVWNNHRGIRWHGCKNSTCEVQADSCSPPRGLKLFSWDMVAVAETVWPWSLTCLLSVPSQNNFAGPCLIQCLIPNAVWGWHLPLLPTVPLGLLNYHVSLFGSFVFDDIFSRAVLLLQRTSAHFNGVKTIPERSKKQCKLAKYRVKSRWMVWCLKRPR